MCAVLQLKGLTWMQVFGRIIYLKVHVHAQPFKYIMNIPNISLIYMFALNAITIIIVEGVESCRQEEGKGLQNISWGLESQPGSVLKAKLVLKLLS